MQSDRLPANLMHNLNPKCYTLCHVRSNSAVGELHFFSFCTNGMKETFFFMCEDDR